MKPVAGAAGHIGWHNAAVVDLLALADLAGQSYVTPLPAEAEAGNSGHEQDHVLPPGSQRRNARMGHLQQGQRRHRKDIVIDGQTWRLHEFTSNGTFVVTMSAQPFVVCMTGGGTEQILRRDLCLRLSGLAKHGQHGATNQFGE